MGSLRFSSIRRSGECWRATISKSMRPKAGGCRAPPARFRPTPLPRERQAPRADANSVSLAKFAFSRHFLDAGGFGVYGSIFSALRFGSKIANRKAV